MKLAPPTTIQAVANAFLNYREDLGIDSVIDMFDWAGVSPHQIYWAALGRLPEARSVAEPPANYHPRELIHAALHSEEFQEQIIRLMLEAFRDKRRLIFVHIPKCAGVDLTMRLSTRFPFLPQGLAIPAWTDKAELFSALSEFAKGANNADTVFYGGHIGLPWVLGKGFHRFGDELVTIVREPRARTLSKVNYVIEILRSSHDPMRHDRLTWLQRLGYPRTTAWSPEETLPELARRILRDPGLANPNAICAALGEGDAESAIDALARSDIEITDVTRYDDWARARWGFEPSPRMNPSTPILRENDLTAQDLDALDQAIAEDARLYRLIRETLEATGDLSVRGVAVARRAT